MSRLPEIFEQNADKIRLWKDGLRAKLLKKEKKKTPNPTHGHTDSWEMGYPYTARTEYVIIPTGIGDVYLVRYGKYELNITDYDTW